MAKCKFENRSTLNDKVLSGVNRLADNVATTLGPKGRNVILHQKGKDPIITKDGATVSDFVFLDDEFENAAAQILKQATSQTNLIAGDGTTTSTVLAREIIVKAQRYIAAGSSPIELKRGLDLASTAVIEHLKQSAKQIETLDDIENIATISANNDSVIGKLVMTAVDKAGKDGSITIEESRTSDTTLDIIEGFRLDSGYVASAFVTDERRAAVHYDSPLILITDEKIEFVEQILPALEIISRDGRPLLIVTEEVEGQALAALIMNTVRGAMKIAAVKAPFYGDRRHNMLADLALSTGAEFISRNNPLKLKDIKLKQGVYVEKVSEGSAADKAGIKDGDIILSVDDKKVLTSPMLQGMIAEKRPGDKVDVTIIRDGKEKEISVVLENKKGSTKLKKKEHNEVLNILGAELENLDKEVAKKLDIDGGVKVTELYAGKLRRQTQMRDGFIITHIDGRKIKDVEDVMKALEDKEGGVMLEGIYEDMPGKYYYAFGLNS